MNFHRLVSRSVLVCVFSSLSPACLIPWLVLGVLCVFLGLGGVQSFGQGKAASGATIVGHVVFADTNRPARFASIYLKPADQPDSKDDFFSVLMDSAIVNMQSKSRNGGSATSDDERELNSARTAANGLLTSVGDAMLAATIDSDGGFSFREVPLGTYFVHVKAPGYIDPLTQFSAQELSSHEPEVRKRVVAAVPTISVMGSEVVREDLRLQRGAVISGRLCYDDGSPAAGWRVRAMSRQMKGADASTNLLGIDLSQLPVRQPENTSVTDDMGHFRIAGLPTGKFVLEAKLTTASLDHSPFSPVSSQAGSFLSILGGLSGMSGLRVVVYFGNASRLNDAKEISVHAGDDYAGADIVMSLAASYSIVGSVVSSLDGHAVNDGTVELLARDSNGKDDPSLKLSTAIQADGTFRFDYVPGAGNYVLRAVHANDTTITSKMKLLGSVIAERTTNHSFAPAETTVVLNDADLTGIKLTVGEARK